MKYWSNKKSTGNIKNKWQSINKSKSAAKEHIFMFSGCSDCYATYTMIGFGKEYNISLKDLIQQ